MITPDKIYVSRNFSEDNSPHGLWYLNKSEHDINIEYIRKDVLLEWAKEQASITEKLNGKGAMLKAWNTLIDKLNSM